MSDFEFLDSGQKFVGDTNSKLEQIRLFLSDQDSRNSPNYETEHTSIRAFLQRITTEKTPHDPGLFNNVRRLLVAHQNQIDATKEPAFSLTAQQGLPRTSTRFYMSSGAMALVEDASESKLRDCHPFTRYRDGNYTAFLKAYRTSNDGRPNQYNTSDMRAYEEALSKPLSPFHSSLANQDDFTRKARRRGRRRRLIEYGLNMFASNTEQHRRGNPMYRVVDIPDSILSPVFEPKLYEASQVSTDLARDPFGMVKQYLRFGNDRNTLIEMISRSKTGNQSIDKHAVVPSTPALFPSIVKHHAIKRMRRLQKLYIALLFELEPGDLERVDHEGLEWLLHLRSPRGSFLNLARYFDTRFSRFRSWSDSERASASKDYIDNFYTTKFKTEPDQPVRVDLDFLIKHRSLTEEELLELQAISTTPAFFTLEDRTLELCLRLVNETALLFSIQQWIGKASSLESNENLERAMEGTLRLLGYELRKTVGNRKGRFLTIEEIAEQCFEHDKELPAEESIRVLRQRLIQEHHTNGFDYKLDIHRIWKFADHLADVKKNRIWFSLERTHGQKLYRVLPEVSDHNDFETLADSSPETNPAKAKKVPEVGQGHLFPEEMKKFGPEELTVAMRAGLADGEVHVRKAPSLFPFGETPYQRAVVSRRITRDLESSELMTDETFELDMPTQLEDGRKPFELPPAVERIHESLDYYRKWGIFTADNLHPAFLNLLSDSF